LRGPTELEQVIGEQARRDDADALNLPAVERSEMGFVAREQVGALAANGPAQDRLSWKPVVRDLLFGLSEFLDALIGVELDGKSRYGP